MVHTTGPAAAQALNVSIIDPNVPIRVKDIKSIRIYEFTSEQLSAAVLTPLTLVPSCVKTIEQTLRTLNNKNKKHRRKRERMRPAPQEYSGR